MKDFPTLSRIVFLLPLLALTTPQTNAQTVPSQTVPSQTAPSQAARSQAVPSLEDIKSQADLDKAITALDAAVFDAYNRCDLEKFSTFFVDDVEFYHDQGGVTLGNKALTESIKKNICGGDVRRELSPAR